ncbi:hypothetical protein BH23PLA1_BH23PLA1_15070 [soil metagenome]
MKYAWVRCAAWGLLFALSSVLCGCGRGSGGGSGGEGSSPRLLFVTNSNADWWNAVEKGMLDGGEEFGIRVQMRRNEGDTQGQVDKLREALSLPDVKGVAVSVIEADAPGVIDVMRQLQKAGKVVIVIDSDVAPEFADARRAYIGTNNVKAGEVAGQAAAQLRPQGGKTALFVGTVAAANAREREQGFFQGAGEAFRKSQTWEDGGDHARAIQNVQSALTRDTDLDVLVGLWSYNAPAIAEEVSKSPRTRERVSVVTFDLDQAARKHIADGYIDVSVCQNPYEMGRQGVRLLKALIERDEATIQDVLPDGKGRDTGVRVVVPDTGSPVIGLEGEEVLTIEEMNVWLDSKGLTST